MKKAKAEVETACDRLRAFIITRSRDLAQARTNCEFFNGLSLSPGAEAVNAFIEKLIGTEVGDSGRLPQDAAVIPSRMPGSRRRRRQKQVPIPPGFGDALEKAMNTRRHTLEKASSVMGLDPKTIVKLLNEDGQVHLATLDQASEYTRTTPGLKLSFSG
jgi:hypothetical protein